VGYSLFAEGFFHRVVVSLLRSLVESLLRNVYWIAVSLLLVKVSIGWSRLSREKGLYLI